jgi:hypothetical protein
MDNNIYQSINQLYDKAGYLARYGGDVYITIIVLLVILLVVGYFSIMNKIKPIRANWVKERCNPSVIPYAGLVYKPPGKTVMEATSENFAQCGQTVLQNIAGYAIQPLQYVLSTITQVFVIITKAIASIRALFNQIRNDIKVIVENIMGRLLNIVVPLQRILIAVKSALEKFAGIGTSIIFTIYGAYLALKAFVGSVVTLTIIYLVILTVFIIILWILPWTLPLAIPLTVTWLVIAVILIIVIVFFSTIMRGKSRKVPKKPK